MLLQRSYRRATGLLERFRFVEHFGRAVERALTRLEAPRDEITAARRLFAALGQAHLDERG